MTLFLWHGLRRRGFPVVCLDARRAKKALSANPVKTDANDAEGLAQLVRVSWYKEVQVKSLEAHQCRLRRWERPRQIDLGPQSRS